jgi:peptidoglycan hydrolase FlgJ
MSTPPVSFFADPQSLSALKVDAREQNPEALKKAAQQFESLFTQMLLKSMREANKSFGDSMFGSDQADFYQDMFDDQIAMHLSQGRGLGLADMLVQQLTRANALSAAAGQGTEATAPATSSSEPIASSKSDFVRSMWPHAEQAGRELGVDPQALLAQAALETGWGKSVPCDASGACSYNLFGIKAGSQWSGATVNVPTLEFEEGVAVRKVDRFRSYSSPADSFRDYAGLIRNNSRYASAVGAGGDVASFAAALQEGGYATDPAYADKIVRVANEIRSLIGSADLKSGAAAPLSPTELRNG